MIGICYGKAQADRKAFAVSLRKTKGASSATHKRYICASSFSALTSRTHSANSSAAAESSGREG